MPGASARRRGFCRTAKRQPDYNMIQLFALRPSPRPPCFFGPRQRSAAAADAAFANHGIANPPVSALGLNSEAPAPPSAPSRALTGHMAGLAGVAAPEPLSLEAEVEALAAAETRGAEEDCLANAVDFEARGELIEGQLAVAEVVMNRASVGPLSADLVRRRRPALAILLRPRRHHPRRRPLFRRLAPRRRRRPRRPAGTTRMLGARRAVVSRQLRLAGLGPPPRPLRYRRAHLLPLGPSYRFMLRNVTAKRRAATGGCCAPTPSAPGRRARRSSAVRR